MRPNQGEQSMFSKGLFVAFVLILLETTACAAPPAAAPKAPAAPPQPTEASQIPTEPPTEVPKATVDLTNEPRVDIPDIAGPLEFGAFDLPRERPSIPNGTFTVFESIGTYSNSKSQPFVIVVIGRQPKSVEDYVKSAKFYLEAIPRPISKNEKVEVTPTGKSLEDELLSDPTTENLIIIMDLKDSYAKEDFTKEDYDLLFAVDPSLNPRQVHHYPVRHTNPQVATKISGAQGSVTGTVYRNCLNYSSKTVGTGATATVLGSNSGYRWWDFRVQAGNAISKYSVTGLWTNLNASTTGSITCS